MKPSEHDHYERIVELANCLDEDTLIPHDTQEQIDQIKKHFMWLHEIQEHTLACMEENDLTLRGLYCELRQHPPYVLKTPSEG